MDAAAPEEARDADPDRQVARVEQERGEDGGRRAATGGKHRDGGELRGTGKRDRAHDNGRCCSEAVAARREDAERDPEQPNGDGERRCRDGAPTEFESNRRGFLHATDANPLTCRCNLAPAMRDRCGARVMASGTMDGLTPTPRDMSRRVVSTRARR